MVKHDICHADIAAALGRIKCSESFRNAPQLVNFLSCVVAKTLAGQQQAIKGYTIATEALGRSDDFDPQTDAIVRVEAGRLRRALDLYYLDQGKADPVRIVIPRGTYVPRFEAGCVGPAAPAPLSRRPVVAQPGWRGLAATLPAKSAPAASHRLVPTRRAAAVLVVMSSLLVILFALHRNETGWLARAVRAPLAPPSAGITMRPIVGTGLPEDARRPAA